eukprot:7972378-Heterocapsa_arctica.AAC.1
MSVIFSDLPGLHSPPSTSILDFVLPRVPGWRDGASCCGADSSTRRTRVNDNLLAWTIPPTRCI